MPILPLDQPEPFAATLGVMLYPDDALKAHAFAAHYLAEPLRRFHEAGHVLKYEVLAHIATGAGERLTDLDERWCGGSATGELTKALFALYCTNPLLASWNNAIKIAELTTPRGTSGHRSEFWKAKSRFASVAHFWAAWCIREGQFVTHPEVGYDGYADFESFLTESEILRDWGQTRLQSREKSMPPLPPEVWRVPEGWKPQPRRSDWPKTGMIPLFTLGEDLLSDLNPAGRPKKAAKT